MKKITIILMVCALCISHFSSAQVYEVPVVQRIDSSAYIFEGTVNSTTSFWSDSLIYTSNIITISKIFKGSIVCGTIRIITRGGRVSGFKETITHNLTLVGGQTGIFFCNTTSMPTIFASVTNGTALEVYASEQGFVGEETINGLVIAHDLFATYGDLTATYNYISARTGYTYTDCTTPPTSVNTTDNQNRLDRTLSHLISIRKVVNPKGGFHKSGENLSYSLVNVDVTPGTPNHLEFDVVARGSSNNTYFYNGLMDIQYNSSAFGPTIVVNHKVHITRGSSFSSGYDTVYYADQSANVLRVQLGAIALTSTPKVNVTTTGVTLMHISIDISTCASQTADLALTDTGSTSYYAIFLPTATANDSLNESYDQVMQVSSSNIPLCISTTPEITSMSPTTLTAGTNTTLAISGHHFGSSRGSGIVYFNDASSADPYAPADPCDILLWSDTLIHVIVPSKIDSSTVTSKHTAGSGDVSVKNNSGQVSAFTINDLLTVQYAITNDRKAPTGYKYRMNLYDNNSLGGYSFKYNISFYNNTIARKIFAKSMRDWICATEVDFRALTGTTYKSADTLYSSMNIVSFGKLPTGVLGQTDILGGSCIADTTKYVGLIINTRYSNSVAWDFDTTSAGVPAGTYDFYSVVLHEMGHAVMLDHVSAPAETMSRQLGKTQKKRTITTEAVAGGSDVVTTSSTESYTCSYVHMGILSGFCTSSGIKSPYDLSNNLKIFPNPTNSNFFIQFSLQKDEPFSICLYDIRGKEISIQNQSDNIDGNQQIEIKALQNQPTGIYLLKIMIGSSVYSQKIIKE